LNTQFKESFLKDLRAIKDRDLLARVNEIIQTVVPVRASGRLTIAQQFTAGKKGFRDEVRETDD
jgi:hypothetical protein